MQIKTKILAILSVFVLAILSGCVTGPKQVISPTGEKVTINNGGSGPSWCKAGTQITASGTGAQGEYTIKGITTYKGQEVCEAEIKTGQGSVSYYYSQDEQFAVMVMKDTSGKVINEVNIKEPNK